MHMNTTKYFFPFFACRLSTVLIQTPSAWLKAMCCCSSPLLSSHAPTCLLSWKPLPVHLLSSSSCSLSLCVSLILLLALPLCLPPPDCAVLRWSKGSSMTRPTPWWTLQRWVFKAGFKGSIVLAQLCVAASSGRMSHAALFFGEKQIGTNSICTCDMHFRKNRL